MSSIDTQAGRSTKSDSNGPGWSLPRTGTVVVLLVALALALRLWELGDRPFHHDESLDAWWSWLFRRGQYQEYDPVYHGPLRFYITAGFYELFGESEAVARLFSALTGTAVVGLPWFLRRELGRAGTIAAAVALTISPTMLYYSRFGREDAQMVFLTLLAMVLGLSYLRSPRISTAAGLAFTLSCSFAIKESTYLFGLLLAVYLLVIVAAQFDHQARTDRGLDTSETGLNPAFVSSALLFATAGLLISVVVGAAADELFMMITLYGLGLALFTGVAALPRLRRAGIRWSLARAFLCLTALIVTAFVARAVRAPRPTQTIGEDGEVLVTPPVHVPWDLSIFSVAMAALFGLAAVGFLVVPALRQLKGSSTWVAAFSLGALGLAAKEWFESQNTVAARMAHEARQLAAAQARDPESEAPELWQVSILMLVLGSVIVLASAVVLLVRDDAIKLPAVFRSPIGRTIAGASAVTGLAILANEYTESDSRRLIAVAVIVLVVSCLTAIIVSLPHTTTQGFEWPPALRAVGAIGWFGWIVTLATFAISWFLFFTVWGRVKGDWASGFTRAIDYWDSQQEVNRGGQPWYYYLYATPAYEWLFVVLAFVGGWRALRRPTVMSALFVWFAIGSLILYSYAGERMPWLIAHPLLPVLILAGMGVQQLWVHRGNKAVPAIAVVLAGGLLFTTGTSIRASFPNGADSREILSQAGQATPHLTAALERLDNIDRISIQNTGEPAKLAIGSANAWPYSWYLRDRDNLQWFTNETGPPRDGSVDVIIVDRSTINPENFPDYQPTLFAMRSWWVPTYNDAGPFGWVSWARNRELWEQQPNPNFFGVREVEPEVTEPGLVETLRRIQDGTNASAERWVGFTGAEGEVTEEAADEETIVNDGRDGCGSVDQWFLVHNNFAFTESQVYPGPIAKMGPLDCASDFLATS